MTRARDVADTQDNLGGAVPPFTAGKNAMLNGDFSVWQRGTTINLTNGGYFFTADRWRCVVNFTAGTASVSRQAFTPGTAPVAGYEGQYFFRLNTGTTASTVILDTKIENVQTHAGRTVTFSFWGRASGNFTLKDTFRQEFGSGGSTSVDSTVVSYNLTTSWQRFTRTLTLPSLAGKTIGTGSSLQIYLEQGTGALGGFNIDLWGMQLEAGSVATPFQTATGNLQAEIAACQRYYYRTTSTAAGARLGLGQCRSTTEAIIQTIFPVPLRVAPTALEQTGTASNYLLQDASGSGVSCNTVPAFNDATIWSAFTSMTRASGLVAGNITTSTVSAANIYLGWSAELS